MTPLMENISKEMESKGISQADLAKIIEKPKASVNSWFTRELEPKTMDAYKIAKALNTSVEYLVTGEDPDKKEMSDVRRKFLNFVNESSDEDLQKLWDFFMVLRGRE